MLNAIRRMGYAKDEMSTHGFRSLASTLLNELGYNRDWIERQLAHGERNDVRFTLQDLHLSFRQHKAFLGGLLFQGV